VQIKLYRHRIPPFPAICQNLDMRLLHGCITALGYSLAWGDVRSPQCSHGQCVLEEDVETDAMVNEHGISLLQTHIQLQGNLQTQNNHTSNASSLTNSSLGVAGPDNGGMSYSIEDKKPVMGIFNRKPIYATAMHGVSYKFPMGKSDSWPTVPVFLLELLFVGLWLLRSRGLLPSWSWYASSPGKGPTKAAVSAPIKPASVANANEPKLLHHRITLVAKEFPGRLALIDGDHRETFGELQASALFVAKYLVQDRAVTPCSRTPIGVCAEGRCMMHAILGIVNTGNPYVSLPPNIPATQRDFIVGDSEIKVVLTDAASIAPGGPWEGRAEASPADVLLKKLIPNTWKPTWQVKEDDLSYVLYTSGSTGKPKGVLAPHSAYFNRLKWMWEAYPLAEGEVGIQKTAIGWIDHVQEVFGYLGGGVPLVLAPPEARTNPLKLINLCKEHSVTRLVLVPSLGRVLMGAFGAKLAEELPSLRFWLCSGEPFPKELLEGLLKNTSPGSTVLNTYGTTEVAGDVTWAAYGGSTGAALPSGDMVPVGKAIPPNVVHLLDPETLQHVPAGETGEIFIEGPHLAVGYHKRPEENAERFIALPGLGVKQAFRTGDFGKLDADNMIQYAGRKDQQVKVHGQRVEVLQVECALGDALLDSSPDPSKGIKPACAVMAIPSEKDPGSYRLLAFVETDGSLDDPKLRTLMKRSLLPAHIPESIIAIKPLPKLVNGKLDRMALKQVAASHASKAEESGVKEELDSFGQIRKILLDHIDGRRIVGTLNAVSLITVVASHWFYTEDVLGMDVGVKSPKWTEKAADWWFLTGAHDVACLMAGVGALHGMGDDSKFKLSVFEPAFLFCCLLIHVGYELFLPPECWIGHLYFLSVMLVARLWVMAWHAMIKLVGTNNDATDVLSVLMAAFVFIFRNTHVLSWWTPLFNVLTRPVAPVYVGSYQFLSIYGFGFYFGPRIIKKASSFPVILRLLSGLCLFIVSAIALTKFDFETGVPGKEAYELFLRFVYIASMWIFVAGLPAWIDVTLPGPTQLICYVMHMPFMPMALHGFTFFHINIFPSFPDILVLAGKAPSPIDGIGQILVLVGYIVGYFIFIVCAWQWLGSAVSGGYSLITKSFSSKA